MQKPIRKAGKIVYCQIVYALGEEPQIAEYKASAAKWEPITTAQASTVKSELDLSNEKCRIMHLQNYGILPPLHKVLNTKTAITDNGDFEAITIEQHDISATDAIYMKRRMTKIIQIVAAYTFLLTLTGQVPIILIIIINIWMFVG